MTPILLIALALVAAPAPVPKERPQRVVVYGEWVDATWGGKQWTVCLNLHEVSAGPPSLSCTSGAYNCLYNGQSFTGRWSFDRASGFLKITERPDTLPWGPASEYTIALDGNWKGRTTAGVSVDLSSILGKRP